MESRENVWLAAQRMVDFIESRVDCQYVGADKTEIGGACAVMEINTRSEAMTKAVQARLMTARVLMNGL